MLKRNKQLFAYLLALGLLLAQVTLVYAEYDHPLHAADAKCPICLAVDHLTHGLIDTGLTLQLNQHVSLPVDDSIALLAIPVSSSYFIRGPPLV